MTDLTTGTVEAVAREIAMLIHARTDLDGEGSVELANEILASIPFPDTAKGEGVEAAARAMARLELAMGDPEHEVQARVEDQWPLYKPLAEAALAATPGAARVAELEAALRSVAASKLTPGTRYNTRMARGYERIVATARAALASPQPGNDEVIERTP